MIIPAPNDVALSLLGFNIYWYGICMAFAIFVAIITANEFFNYHNEKKNVFLNSAPLIIIFGVIGARLYYCLLNIHHYFFNITEIFNIREGGLSIHGAIIGGILSLIIISKKYKINFLKLLDYSACATILGQAIGRWGNYFNSEAYGLPTNQIWGLYIPINHRIAEFVNYELFHPTFLYESILNLITFFILTACLFKNEKKVGLTFFLYMTLYGIIRFFIEQIRIDSALNIGQIPIAVIVSAIIFLIGMIGTIFTIRKH